MWLKWIFWKYDLNLKTAYELTVLKIFNLKTLKKFEKYYYLFNSN